MNEIMLRYIGNGSTTGNLPPRDLTCDEIAGFEREFPEAGDIAQLLVDTGLYEWANKSGGSYGDHHRSQTVAS